ncbi:amidase [Nocardia sp. NPDC003482]
MRYDEYRAHDAVGLARLVADGQVRPLELLELALARYERVGPVLNPMAILLAEVGRARAAGPLTGPLAGVPFLVKDLEQHFAGYPTSAGTAPLQAIPAEEHSLLVRRWLDAGLVIFGKTTTPEFGMKAVTESSAFGATRNPWDPERTPGGSSGGSAAAVAAGIVPVAGGNDGGGSLRIPAAWTGLFALKPGRGLVPCGTSGGDALHGLAADGVLSRTVRDSAVMLDVLAGPDPGARYYRPRPGGAYAEAVRTPPGKLRIAVDRRSPLGTPIHAEATHAVERTAALLESLGHEIVDAAPKIDGIRFATDFTTVWTAHAAAEVAGARRRTGAPERAFDFDTRALAAAGRALSARELIDAYERWNDYARALAALHADHDLLLTPTVAEPPPRVGSRPLHSALESVVGPLLQLGAGRWVTRHKIFRETVFATMAATPFTPLANVTGRPAMSVPLHRTPENLPLGTQFIGPPDSESLLLRLAAQLEQAAPWSHLEPPDPAPGTRGPADRAGRGGTEQPTITRAD